MKSYAQYFVLQVLFVTWTLAASHRNYCGLCKEKGTQTVCARPGCPVVGRCADYPQTPFTSAEKHLLVQRHNELRNNVAIGNQTGQPAAANMNKLKWNDELAHIAQCWANACVYEHDTCRNTHSMYVGQNLVYVGSSEERSISAESSLIDGIQSWYDEVNLYSGPIDDYVHVEPTVHYTQLVWAETTDIGCAKVAFKMPYELNKDITLYSIYLFCNYGIGGNAVGQAVYKEGQPCSQCEDNKTCDREFTGLCS